MLLGRMATVLCLAWTSAAPASEVVIPDLVRKTQQRLLELEWFAGPVDGKMGPMTRAAISDYQRFAGIPVTGEPSADWVGLLFLPCQIAFIEGRSQAQYGCRKPREVAPGVFEQSLEAPKPSYPDRKPCHAPPVAQARHTEVPALRFDGFYQEHFGNYPTIVRFFPDGMMILALSDDEPRFVPCWFTRERTAAAGNPPQPYVIEGGTVRFEIPSKKGKYKYEGEITEDTFVLKYHLYYTTGDVLIGNTAGYKFQPDQPPASLAR